MDNTNKIRELLKKKIVAARNAALHTNDYMIPLERRYLIKMSIRELKQILALFVREKKWICKECGNNNGDSAACRLALLGDESAGGEASPSLCPITTELSPEWKQVEEKT